MRGDIADRGVVRESGMKPFRSVRSGTRIVDLIESAGGRPGVAPGNRGSLQQRDGAQVAVEVPIEE